MGNQNKISKKRKQKQINDKENIENIEKINNIKSNDLLSPSILGKIKSKYNLSNIFDYVKDDNFKYKLFKYSKLFQEKLELNLTKYRVKYLERFKINPKIFLNFIEFGSDISLGKDIIKKGLTNYLAKNKIEENIFQSFVIEYFKKYFTFTLLEWLDKKVPANKVIERENYWKEALDTRTHGYNNN